MNAPGFASVSNNYHMKCTCTIAQSVERLYPELRWTMSLADPRLTRHSKA